MWLAIRNDMDELGRVTEAIDAEASRAGLAAGVVQDLRIVADEVLSNLIHHAFPDGGAHRIEVAIETAAGRVDLRIRDDGVAFNPFDDAPPARPAAGRALEEVDEGGLGLLFVRHLIDHMAYERRDGFNHLYLVKNLDAAGAQSDRGSQQS